MSLNESGIVVDQLQMKPIYIERKRTNSYSEIHKQHKDYEASSEVVMQVPMNNRMYNPHNCCGTRFNDVFTQWCQLWEQYKKLTNESEQHKKLMELSRIMQHKNWFGSNR